MRKLTHDEIRILFKNKVEEIYRAKIDDQSMFYICQKAKELLGYFEEFGSLEPEQEI